MREPTKFKTPISPQTEGRRAKGTVTAHINYSRKNRKTIPKDLKLDVGSRGKGAVNSQNLQSSSWRLV